MTDQHPGYLASRAHVRRLLGFDTQTGGNQMTDLAMTPRDNDVLTPQVVGMLYHTSSFGKVLDGMTDLPYPKPYVTTADPRRTYKRTDSREYGRVTARWFEEQFGKRARDGYRPVDDTVAIVVVTYEEAD